MGKDKLKNHLPMSAKTGDFRQQVLAIIHKAKYEHNMKLPMVKYRISADESWHQAMGVGGRSKGKAEIRINEKYFDTDRFLLVVLHELAHACWGQEHIEGCPLMSPTYLGNITDEKAWELFDMYYKHHNIALFFNIKQGTV